jgi:hypothetical protein
MLAGRHTVACADVRATLTCRGGDRDHARRPAGQARIGRPRQRDRHHDQRGHHHRQHRGPPRVPPRPGWPPAVAGLPGRDARAISGRNDDCVSGRNDDRGYLVVRPVAAVGGDLGERDDGHRLRVELGLRRRDREPVAGYVSGQLGDGRGGRVTVLGEAGVSGPAPYAVPPLVPALERADVADHAAGGAAAQEVRAPAGRAGPVLQARMSRRAGDLAARTGYRHDIGVHFRMLTLRLAGRSDSGRPLSLPKVYRRAGARVTGGGWWPARPARSRGGHSRG